MGYLKVSADPRAADTKGNIEDRLGVEGASGPLEVQRLAAVGERCLTGRMREGRWLAR